MVCVRTTIIYVCKGVFGQTHIGFGGVVVFGCYGRLVYNRFLEAISTHGTLGWLKGIELYKSEKIYTVCYGGPQVHKSCHGLKAEIFSKCTTGYNLHLKDGGSKLNTTTM